MALVKALSRRVNGTVAWIRQDAETISARGTVYAMEHSDTCSLSMQQKQSPHLHKASEGPVMSK